MQQKMFRFLIFLLALFVGLSITACSDKKKYSHHQAQQQDDKTKNPDTENPNGDDSKTPDNGQEPDSETPDNAGSPVALQGQIAFFPEEASSAIRPEEASFIESVQTENDSTLQGPATDEEYSLSHDDMEPKEALVGLYRLDDIDYEDPIATVTTDEAGEYKVTADDVRDYLKAKNHISDEASDEALMTAFRALGEIQVRALIVTKDDKGDEQVVAIQSLADPSEIDETTGEPKPVQVNPIAHRVVKAIMEQIRETMGSLRELGVTDEKVEELSKNVIKDIAKDIRRAVREAAESRLPIPVGKSPKEIIKEQAGEMVVELSEAEREELKDAVKAKGEEKKAAISKLTEKNIHAKKTLKKVAKLVASLDSAEQGVISQLKEKMKAHATGKVEALIDEGDDATVAEYFGVDEADQQAILALKEESKVKTKEVSKAALNDFFLSMGFSVILDRNAEGSAGVVAVNIPYSPYVLESYLPGGHFSEDDRNIRLFKVGLGELDAESVYTADFNEVEAGNKTYYAAPLESLVKDLLGGDTAEGIQQSVDEAYDRLGSGSGTDEDHELMIKVSLLHELDYTLQDINLIPLSVVSSLHEHKGNKITLKGLASVIAEHFEWMVDPVQLTDEGLPVFSEKMAKLAGRDNKVSPAEILRAISFRLGTSAKDTAKHLTEREAFYAPFIADALTSNIDMAYELDNTDSLFDALALAYPRSKEEMKALVVGGSVNAPSEGFMKARDRLVRGLTTAMPRELFGTQLKGETKISLSAAVFFIDYLTQVQFSIKEKDGFIKPFKVKGKQAQKEAERFVPNFNNLKFLTPKEDVTAAMVIAALMNMSNIPESSYYHLAQDILMMGVMELPLSPEYVEPDIEDVFEEEYELIETVSASCVLERVGDNKPLVGEHALGVELTALDYDIATGIERKGKSIDGIQLDIKPVPGTGNRQVKYTLSGIPSYVMAESEKRYGVEYQWSFTGAETDLFLPELYLWLDGYVDEIVLCDENYPLFIGEHELYQPLPVLGIGLDQMAYDDEGEETYLEGIDLSSFLSTHSPIYVTAADQEDGLGLIDMVFIEEGDQLVLSSFDDNGSLFAPLYGELTDAGWEVSLTEGGNEPLYGLNQLLGANLARLMDEVRVDSSLMQDAIVFDEDLEQFDYERLYLMRDAEGAFWVIELAHLEVFKLEEEEVFLDFHFVKLDDYGEVIIPEPIFEKGDEFFFGQSFFSQYLFVEFLDFGDWLILEPPSTIDDLGVVSTVEAILDDNLSHVVALKDATDGAVLRLSGQSFDGLIQSKNDLFHWIESEQTVFEDLKLEVQREGISLQKLTFDKGNQAYLIGSPSSELAVMAGDIVVMLDESVDEGESSIFLGYVVDADQEAHRLMIEWADMRFLHDLELPQDIVDDRNIICGDECEGLGLPKLFVGNFHAEPQGFVVDSDHDGVPSLFDENDHDPFVAGRYDIEEDEEETVMWRWAFSEQAGVTQAQLDIGLILYPGDVAEVKLNSPLLGDDWIVAATCQPPAMSGEGLFTDMTCESQHPMIKDVTVAGESMLLHVVPTTETLAALAESETFIDVNVHFGQPVDYEGNPLMCGSFVCESWPPLHESLSINVPSEVHWPDTISAIQVAHGEGESAALQSMDTLDLMSDVVLSAESVDAADWYQLVMVCQSSEQILDFWLPPMEFVFDMDAYDTDGNPEIPSFHLIGENIPGKQVCDIHLGAHLEDDELGENAISQIVIKDVTVMGVNDVFLAPEMPIGQKLMTGQQLCLTDQGMDVMDSCNEGQALFSLLPFAVNDAAGLAGIQLAEGILPVLLDEETLLLAPTVFNANEIYSLSDDFPCGQLGERLETNDCPQDIAMSTTDLLKADDDGNSLMLTDVASDWLLHGLPDGQSVINLAEAGEYVATPKDSHYPQLTINVNESKEVSISLLSTDMAVNDELYLMDSGNSLGLDTVEHGLFVLFVEEIDAANEAVFVNVEPLL